MQHKPTSASRPLGLDPWSAEIATMNHAATNLSDMVDGVGSLIGAFFRALDRGIQALRRAAPVEFEPLVIPRAMPETTDVVPEERRAAA